MRLPAVLVGLSMMTASVFAGCEQLSVDTSQGTVRDNASGLIWSRCLLGQVGNGCLGHGVSLSRVEAMNKARAVELGGVSNWRLPKNDEYARLFALGPGCVAAAFPGSATSVTWSASANSVAWAFDLVKGIAVMKSRDSKLQVLLVASPR